MVLNTQSSQESKLLNLTVIIQNQHADSQLLWCFMQILAQFLSKTALKNKKKYLKIVLVKK